jgi:DNA-binding response OmpR family regulator
MPDLMTVAHGDRMMTVGASTPAAGDAARPIILLVETDPDLSPMFSRLLSKAGYRVQVAAGPEAARRYLVDALPQLVLIDLPPPYLEGRELIAELQQQFPTIEIIAMTTSSPLPSLPEAPLLSKPFPMPQLLALVAARVR